jgi:hypothetical protein
MDGYEAATFGSISVYEIDADFDEATLTWNNRPAAGVLLYTTFSSANGLRIFDVLAPPEHGCVAIFTIKEGETIGLGNIATSRHEMEWKRPRIYS